MKFTQALLFSTLCTFGALPALTTPALAAKAATATAQAPSAAVLSNYIVIQQKLAADTIDGVSKAALAIARSNSPKEITESAQKVADAKTIVEARTEFKALSKPISSWIQTSKKPGYEVYRCSMASAKWVQKKGSTTNPYYGKEMLDCGDKLTD